MALHSRLRSLLLLMVAVVAVVQCFGAMNEQTSDKDRILTGLTWDTREQLLLVVQKLGKITGEPVPVYREDLPAYYAAYWCFELNNTDYVILSSGPKTGDYGLAIQGALPSPIIAVNKTAAGYGKSCKRFFMFTPSGEILCRDSNGDIAATSAEDRFFPEAQDGEMNSHNDLENRMYDFRILWRRRAQRVKEEGVWGHTTREAANKDGAYFESTIAPGGVIRLPVDGDTAAVHVQYVTSPSGESDNKTKTMQKKLCMILSTCRPQSGNHTRQDLSDAYSLNGVPCLDTVISTDAYKVFNNSSISMRVVVTTRSQKTFVQHYSLQMTTHKRTRRRVETESWSADYVETKIAHDGEFPNYKQHTIKWTSQKRVYRIVKVIKNRGWETFVENRNMSVPVSSKYCNVGLGPVAWAEIFCYFDRRSHKYPSQFGSGSQSLYRCGRHAIDGSPNCVAPDSATNWRLRHYINEIARAMKSVCGSNDTAVGDSSWTPTSKMGDVNQFYKARQLSGNPRVVKVYNEWSEKITKLQRKLTRYVGQNWPVIVGTIEAGKRHYAVITAFRYKTRRYRKCTGSGTNGCGSWKTGYSDFQMYAHQGDGTNGNRWRPMDVHYVICAKY